MVLRTRMLTGARALWADKRGAALIYISLLLPVLIGGGVMAVDAGRLYNLQTTLQKGADALAMAGAAELDRKPSSIARATAAINGLLANQDKFATGGVATVTAGSVRFLRSLPASDTSAIDATHVTADPLLARFVEVVVAPHNFNTILPASFVGGSNTKTTSARAVAGFTAALCKTVPMFICNPYELETDSLFDVVANRSLRRRQLKLQLGGGGTNAQFFPGNYGWLDTPSLGNGATALRDALAQKAPNSCYIQNGVSQKTGNIENANDALNTRFDLWAGPFNNAKNNASYPPATNVRKGYVPGPGANGACNPSEVSPNNARLGRDSAFPSAGGRLGNGNWNFEQYWSTNYGTTALPSSLTGASNSNLPTRHEVYEAEVDSIGGSPDLVAHQSPAPYNERGTPQCYSGAGTPTADRRIIYVAIINCSNLAVTGNTGGPLPVLAFGKFFLTEPIPNPPNSEAGTIFAELVGLAEPGNAATNEVSHDIVQLYR